MFVTTALFSKHLRSDVVILSGAPRLLYCHKKPGRRDLPAPRTSRARPLACCAPISPGCCSHDSAPQLPRLHPSACPAASPATPPSATFSTCPPPSPSIESLVRLLSPSKRGARPDRGALQPTEAPRRRGHRFAPLHRRKQLHSFQRTRAALDGKRHQREQCLSING